MDISVVLEKVNLVLARQVNILYIGDDHGGNDAWFKALISVLAERKDIKLFYERRNLPRFDIIISSRKALDVSALFEECAYLSTTIICDESYAVPQVPLKLQDLIQVKMVNDTIFIIPKLFYLNRLATYLYHGTESVSNFPAIIPSNAFYDDEYKKKIIENIEPRSVHPQWYQVWKANGYDFSSNEFRTAFQFQKNIQETKQSVLHYNFCVICLTDAIDSKIKNFVADYCKSKYSAGEIFSNNLGSSIRWGDMVPSHLSITLSWLFHTALEIIGVNIDPKGLIAVIIGKYIPLFDGCCSYSGFCLCDEGNFVDSIIKSCDVFDSDLDSYVLQNAKSIFMQKSTKSAIGSIMSRNGSHNIGSHVLAALTHHVGTMPDDRVLYQYLQQRMDYIATVTTDFPSWGSSTMFVGDMMKTFFSQRHLLEYISGSEGLHAYRFQDPNLGETERMEQTGKIKLFIRRIKHNINTSEVESKYGWHLADNAKEHALHFIRYPDKEKIHFIDYKDYLPLPLQHDVALAIPGGVIGEHAFFTILENIIRNAAKHGWASHSRRADNLEIYIDFLDNPDSDYIEFTVWDNMSDVLRPVRRQGGATEEGYARFLEALGGIPEDKSAELDKNSKQYRTAWVKAVFRNWPKALCLLLEWEKMEKELKTAQSDAEKKTITEKINGIQNKLKDICPDTPNQTNLDDRINSVKWELEHCLTSRSRDEFENFLQATLTKAEIDALKDVQKYIPLHWKQQILLTDKLITDQGELRRENWGLAEMKISAGYLQLRSVGEIGGLKDLPEDDHIILPVAVPGVCDHPDNPNGGIRCGSCIHKNHPDCPIRNKLYHLGYRFKVPKPREMLIVLPPNNDNQQPTAPQKLAEFKKAGVYFAKEKDGAYRFCDNSKEVKNFNFDYVVFPNEATAIECGNALLPKAQSGEQEPPDCWKSPFPFRLLADKAETAFEKVITQAREAGSETGEKQKEKIQSLKNEVYKLWLEKLKSERQETRPLTMQLQTDGSSGSGRGLITDRDLLEFVFRNNFHSVITNLKPEFADYPDCSMILDLLSVYPEPYSELPKEVSDDIYGVIAGILVFMCDKLEHSWPVIISRWETDRMGFAASYRARIKERLENNYLDRSAAEIRAAVSAFAAAGKTFSDDDLLALIQDDSGHEDDASPFGALVDATGLPSLARALHAAYQTADTLLRKYEERIVTLPQGYSVNDKDEGKAADTNLRGNLKKNIGIELVDHGHPLIKYCRHDKFRGEGTIYAEALSGSQSYLNTLSRITRESKKDNTGTFVQLAENALIRLLIIDERVSNFLKAHPANVRTFEAMNIDVVEIDETVPHVVDTSAKDIKLADLPLITTESLSGKKWDMLIIHQGVIDKWFPEHKKEQVGPLIENLTKAVPYTVVTTGRGRPDNIPDWVKILPFSMLESTLFRKYPEKLLLVGAAMNVLPSSDKNRS